MEMVLVDLITIINEETDENKILDFIDDNITIKNNEEVEDIITEMKYNVKQRRKQYLYLGIIEMCEYLNLDKEIINLDKNYLKFVWENN